MTADDTIVAISTPPGRGGIGIVRLSGPHALSIAAPMLRLRAAATTANTMDQHPTSVARSATDATSAVRAALAANHARFGEFIDPDGNILDQVVATLFAAPHSYTGEDVVEIAAHGSPVILSAIVQQAIARGARLAHPGEFTERAFLSGRIDLTQAEAVRDLIDAQTLQQARVAAQQIGGSLARRIQPIKQSLIELIAALEAGIDFAEDDIDLLPASAIAEKITAVRAPLAALAASFAYGRILRDGITLAIVGRPNAGKSSLFNQLVQRDRAIVTAAPGTTRDTVSERVSLNGIPVELIDTAGLRDSADEAEALGIIRTREAMADADLVLLIRDVTDTAPPDAALLASLADRKHLLVANKIDLLSNENAAPATGATPAVRAALVANKIDLLPTATLHPNELAVSALTGVGLPALRDAIVSLAGNNAHAEPGMLTNIRQQQSIQSSIEALDRALAAVPAAIPHEMLLLDIYAALRSLDTLTGATTADDLLNLIFSTFCIGK